MSARENGGSAFPNDGAWANGHPEGGMMLRDWFAGHALANFDLRGETPARAAKWAYTIADAMLAERKLP